MDNIQRQILDFACRTGKYPEAIFAESEAFHAIRSDMANIMAIADKGYNFTWRGIPVIWIPGKDRVYLAGAFTELKIKEGA